MREERSYDSLPNFTAADCKSKECLLDVERLKLLVCLALTIVWHGQLNSTGPAGQKHNG